MQISPKPDNNKKEENLEYMISSKYHNYLCQMFDLQFSISRAKTTTAVTVVALTTLLLPQQVEFVVIFYPGRQAYAGY